MHRDEANTIIDHMEDGLAVRALDRMIDVERDQWCRSLQAVHLEDARDAADMAIERGAVPSLTSFLHDVKLCRDARLNRGPRTRQAPEEVRVAKTDFALAAIREARATLDRARDDTPWPGEVPGVGRDPELVTA